MTHDVIGGEQILAMSMRYERLQFALSRFPSGFGLAFLEVAAIFLSSLGLLLCFGAFAPFTKELGACESGAVREVLAGGFILPHYRPGSSIVWVPPLSWWTQALAVKALGWQEVALRLPSILGAALTYALLYSWLRSDAGRACALWSVAALLSCRFFVDAARQPRQDALFAALVSAAVIFFERAQRSASPRRNTWLIAVAIAVALATLTKGPLGLVLSGLAATLWLFAEGRLRDLFRPAIVAAFGCALALAALWYVAAYAVGGSQFVQVQIVTCLWDRFTGKLAMCRHPFYFFLPYVITGFLPWSLLLPFVTVELWQNRCRLPITIRLAIFWFLGFLAFFSASSGKCLAYLVPVFPPLAVLTGWAIANFLQNDKNAGTEKLLWRLGTLLAGIGTIALTASAGALGIWGVPEWFLVRLHPTDRETIALLATLANTANASFAMWFIVSLAAGITALLGALAKRPRAGSLGLAAAALAGTMFWFGLVTPARARQTTLKPFIRQVNLIVPADARLAYMGEPDCDASFYLRSELSMEIDKPPSCGASPTLYFIAPENLTAGLSEHQRACLRQLAASQPVDTHGRRLLLMTR
jgi:4-amino-4-deoxy-L-arabinose transferase-like glycosyltransferase